MVKSQRVINMNRTYFFVITSIAIASALLIFYSIWQESQDLPPPTPIVSHPAAPFKSYISAVGIVEASSENIFIGTPLNRIVNKIFVAVGAKVQKGEPLIEFENRDLEATLQAQQVGYEIALAQLNKLKALPRKEDISSAEAEVKNAEVAFNQAQSQYEMTQGLKDKRALSQEEINRRYFNYQQAEAKLFQAQAMLNKVKAGTWKPDLKIAHLEALQAKANVERIKADIDQTIIRSPIDGKILQIKIHEGEIPSINSSRIPMMVLGNTDEKHLEVSINQFNAPYFRQNAPAVAFLQGNPHIQFDLEFIKLEPYLVSKQNITNNLTEKVDTRVLQVTYRFKEDDKKIFVGQVMDVYIEADYTP